MMIVKPIPMALDLVKKVRTVERIKTETRRVIVPQPAIIPHADNCMVWEWKGKRYSEAEFLSKCLYQVGDLLWLREPLIQGPLPEKEIRYESDGEPVFGLEASGSRERKNRVWQWKRKKLNARYMPSFAARTYLRLTSRGIEELQAISRASIIREGFPSGDPMDFRSAWDALNQGRGYSWNANPFNWFFRFVWEESLEYADLEKLKMEVSPMPMICQPNRLKGVRANANQNRMGE